MKEKVRHEEQNRLGHPDFTGTWETGYSTKGKFQIYILRRNQTSEVRMLSGTPLGKGENIEGVIYDQLGLAVFSGMLTKDYVTFEKIYCQAAVMGTALPYRLQYEGFYNGETGKYEGEYCTHEGRNRGRFVLSKATIINPQGDKNSNNS